MAYLGHVNVWPSKLSLDLHDFLDGLGDLVVDGVSVGVVVPGRSADGWLVAVGHHRSTFGAGGLDQAVLNEVAGPLGQLVLGRLAENVDGRSDRGRDEAGRDHANSWKKNKELIMKKSNWRQALATLATSTLN